MATIKFVSPQVLDADSKLLRNISHYHFNGLGKAIRPNIVLTAAKAFNSDSDHTTRYCYRFYSKLSILCANFCFCEMDSYRVVTT